jgi:hypothetical protein
VYSRAIGTGFFRADVLAYMEAAKQNEQDHYDALAKVLGKAAPKGVMFTYPSGTFASAKSIAATGVALETAFVGAYPARWRPSRATSSRRLPARSAPTRPSTSPPSSA